MSLGPISMLSYPAPITTARMPMTTAMHNNGMPLRRPGSIAAPSHPQLPPATTVTTVRPPVTTATMSSGSVSIPMHRGSMSVPVAPSPSIAQRVGNLFHRPTTTAMASKTLTGRTHSHSRMEPVATMSHTHHHAIEHPVTTISHSISHRGSLPPTTVTAEPVYAAPVATLIAPPTTVVAEPIYAQPPPVFHCPPTTVTAPPQYHAPATTVVAPPVYSAPATTVVAPAVYGDSTPAESPSDADFTYYHMAEPVATVTAYPLTHAAPMCTTSIRAPPTTVCAEPRYADPTSIRAPLTTVIAPPGYSAHSVHTLGSHSLGRGGSVSIPAPMTLNRGPAHGSLATLSCGMTAPVTTAMHLNPITTATFARPTTVTHPHHMFAAPATISTMSPHMGFAAPHTTFSPPVTTIRAPHVFLGSDPSSDMFDKHHVGNGSVR